MKTALRPTFGVATHQLRNQRNRAPSCSPPLLLLLLPLDLPLFLLFLLLLLLLHFSEGFLSSSIGPDGMQCGGLEGLMIRANQIVSPSCFPSPPFPPFRLCFVSSSFASAAASVSFGGVGLVDLTTPPSRGLPVFLLLPGGTCDKGAGAGAGAEGAALLPELPAPPSLQLNFAGESSSAAGCYSLGGFVGTLGCKTTLTSVTLTSHSPVVAQLAVVTSLPQVSALSLPLSSSLLLL